MSKMNSKAIDLKISEDDAMVAYLYLPKHPKQAIPGIVKKTISMRDLMPDYKGIPLFFDFNEENELIGIEIAG